MEALGGRALEFWKPSTVMRAAPGAPPLAAARICSSRLEIVGIVGKLGDVFLSEGVGADAVIGVEAGAVVVVADFDVGVDGGEGEMEVEVEGLAGVAREEGDRSRREAGSGRGEARGSGCEAREKVVAGGVGGGGGAVLCGDGGVGEGCAGGVENGAFDTEAVSAMLRVKRGGNDEEAARASDRKACGCAKLGKCMFHFLTCIMLRDAAGKNAVPIVRKGK